jgi:hypothetical protein
VGFRGGRASNIVYLRHAVVEPNCMTHGLRKGIPLRKKLGLDDISSTK